MPDAPLSVEQKRPVGRPSLKKPELLTAICNRIASGDTLADVCSEEEFPSHVTVLAWAEDDPQFFKELSRARRLQADVWGDQLVQMTDKCPPINEEICKTRLRTQVRQFLMSKHSTRYADKTGGDVHVSQAVNNFVVMTTEKAAQLQERRKKMLEG